MKPDAEAPASEQQRWSDLIHQASQTAEQPSAAATGPKPAPQPRNPKTGRFQKGAK